MADPTKYERDYSFSNFQANQPNKPLPGTEVDIELDNIADAIGGVVDAVKDVRRSDGALQNRIVTEDSLSPELLAWLNSRRDPDPQANTMRLADWLHTDDLAAIVAGDTAAQNGARVTASIRAFHEAVLTMLLSLNGAHVRAVYLAGIYRVNDRLMSDTFNNMLWSAPQNLRSKLTLAADGVVTFRVQNWVPGRASVRTDGMYAGNTRLVPNAVMEWMQPSGYQQFARMEGHFIIEGANNIDTDPMGFYFYRTNGMHIDGQIEVRDLRNRGGVFDSVFNSPRIEHIKINRSVGLQLTEAAGSGLLPSDTVTTVDGDTIRTGLRYTVSGTTLTVQTVAWNQTDGVLVSSTPATGIFTADHVGKWIGLDRQGPTQITTSDSDDGEETEAVFGVSVTRWFQIASFVDSGTVTLTEAPPFTGSTGQRSPHLRRFTFGPLRVTTTAGSNVATLSMPVTTSLVGHEVIIPGAGFQTASLRSNMPARNLVAMVTAHTGNTITLSHAARRTRTGVPITPAPMLHVGTLSHTQFLTTSRKCDHLHIDALWIENAAAPGLSMFVQDVTKFTIGEGSKIHGAPNTSANYGANFAAVVAGDVGGRWDGSYTHSRHSREWGMFYIAADRVELKIDGEVSSWTADAGSSLFYLDPIGEDASPDWDLYFNAIDYASGFPNVSGGQVFERGGANYVRGLVKSASSVRMPRAERPVWPPTQLSPSRAPWWGSTRADAVSALARGGVVPENGVVYTIGGLQYIGVTGATMLPGLPGLEPYGGVWTPLHFGAVGDVAKDSTGQWTGGTDDGAVLNLMFAAFRDRVEAAGPNNVYVIDGLGLGYRSTISVDCTRITAITDAMFKIRNFNLISSAVGKNALDMIGTRGGHLEDVLIWGDPAAQPRVGLMAARGVTAGPDNFCDHMLMTRVRTLGHFSLTAVYFYGQESTTYLECLFWNENPNAHCGVLVGLDHYPVQSDYATAITGETSYINNQYARCDFRHFPASGASLITAMTMANPLVVTVNNGAGFNVGDVCVLGEMIGADESYNLKAEITGKSGNVLTFGLVNATGWTPWVSGGLVIRSQTVSTLVFGRGDGHNFDSCYFVNYGTDSIEWVIPTGHRPQQVNFRSALFEGYGTRSNLRFLVGTDVRTVYGMEFSTWNGRGDFLFSTDASGGGRVVLGDVKVSCPIVVGVAGTTFLSDPARFSFQGANVTMPSLAEFNPATAFSFRGILYDRLNGETWEIDHDVQGDIRRQPYKVANTNDYFLNAAGAIVGFKRHDPVGLTFTYSLNGSNVHWAMSQTAFYPNTDNTSSLGLGGGSPRRFSNVWAVNSWATAAIGYAATFGAGGTVTQITSKSTAVTRNSRSGLITMHDEALAAGASVEFTVNNTAVSALTQVMANITGAFGGYRLDVVRVTAGLFVLRLTNTTGGSLSEAVTIQFSLFNGATT